MIVRRTARVFRMQSARQCFGFAHHAPSELGFLPREVGSQPIIAFDGGPQLAEAFGQHRPNWSARCWINAYLAVVRKASLHPLIVDHVP